MESFEEASKHNWTGYNFSCGGESIRCKLNPADNVFDADIVGPGAIASFITSAAITILCILAAYFFDAFDPGLPMEAADRAIRTWAGSTTGRTSSISARSKKPRSSEAFERFILAMSDQQLISGMAILIAIYAKACDVSVYTFEVATALAWLSWTTHLATLAILWRYFRAHKPALWIRMVLLVIFFLLLQASLIIIFTKLAGFLPGLRFACVCSAYSLGATNLFPPAFRALSVLNLIFMLVWMYDAFIETLITLLSKPTEGSTSPSGNNQSNDSPSNKLTWLEALHLLYKSFFRRIISVLFSFSFGIAMLAWFRNRTARELPIRSAGIHELSVGQIFPLLLLLLPLMAAAEAWSETKSTAQAQSSEAIELGQCPPPGSSDEDCHAQINTALGRRIVHKPFKTGGYRLGFFALTMFLYTQACAVLAAYGISLGVAYVPRVSYIPLIVFFVPMVYYLFSYGRGIWKSYGRKALEAMRTAQKRGQSRGDSNYTDVPQG